MGRKGGCGVVVTGTVDVNHYRLVQYDPKQLWKNRGDIINHDIKISVAKESE